MATEYVTWLRQMVCGLQGHDNLMEFGRGRLRLKCMSCGHQTPGWEIRSRGSADTADAGVPEPAPRRRFLPQFAGARRLA
jgi:hypothetical protein